MSIATQLIKAENNLANSRKAIVYKGGTVGEVAKFDNLASEIASIPSGDVNYLLVDDTDTEYKKQILAGASPLVKIKSVGGMTYKCNNLVNLGTVEINTYKEYPISLSTGVKYYVSAFVESNDTDADASLMYFISDDNTEAGYISFARNQRTKKALSFTKNVTKFRLYSSDNYNHSVGDTSIWKDIMITTEDTDIYEPYFEGLRDTKVTSLVSHGKNLLPDDVKDASSWVNHNPDWYSYNLALPDGWYCISVKLKEEGKGIPYFYLNKSTDGGKTYTTSGNVAYSGDGYISTGYMTTGNGLEKNPLWFKVDNKAGIIYRFNFYQLTQSKLDYLYDMQIEAVELAQEPSTSYPPATYAPATEYTPYKGVIDTVTIPDVLRNDAEWGRGVVDYDNTVYSNTYDFNNKQYSKGVSNVIVLDGVTDGRKITMKNSGDRFYVPLSPKGLVNANIAFITTSRQFKKERWGTSGSWTCWIENGTLILKFPTSEFPSITEANAWLAENPIELVYALASPIVTTIEDNAYLPKDNYIEIEGGGTITAVNEHGNAVPFNIAYIRRTT